MGPEGGSFRGESPFVPRSVSERLACESLLGLSVGDALGAPFEGTTLDLSRLAVSIEPSGRAPWTDDTQMASSIVETLLANGAIDQDRLARAFAHRYESWRGYGRGMHRLLPLLNEGKDWRELKDEVFPGGSYGNGAAMRVAPLGAFYHDASVDTVIREARRSAEVTHAHAEALAGAATTAVAAWLAARSRRRAVPPFSELCSATGAALHPSLKVSRGIEAAAKLSPAVDLAHAVARLGNGSNVTCFDTVPLAVWIAFRHLDDFEAAIRHAVAAGGDTDTLAAIVGGIVAARKGLHGIPRRWRRKVEPLPLEPA